MPRVGPWRTHSPCVARQLTLSAGAEHVPDVRALWERRGHSCAPSSSRRPPPWRGAPPVGVAARSEPSTAGPSSPQRNLPQGGGGGGEGGGGGGEGGGRGEGGGGGGRGLERGAPGATGRRKLLGRTPCGPTPRQVPDWVHCAAGGGVRPSAPCSLHEPQPAQLGS